MQSNKLIDILKNTIKYYNNKNIKKNKIEAIFSKVLNLDRLSLYTNFDREITDIEKNKLKKELSNLNKEKDNIFEDDMLKNLLEKSIKYLKKNNIDEASLKTEIIFSKVLNIDRMSLFMNYTKKLTNEEKEIIRQYLYKVAINKLPISYLFNEQIFYGYKFYVDNSVLIPRLDTEILVEEVLKNVLNDEKILDLGCGSGAIGITIALEKPNSKILCSDISPKCVEITQMNKNLLKSNNVKVIESDLFQNISFKEFDIIVSNPPYIDIIEEVEEMSDDTMHEPKLALYASEEGFYFYHKISELSKNHLKNNGKIFFEIGYKQAERVVNILKNYGYTDIEVIKDYNNNDRVVKAKYIKDINES